MILHAAPIAAQRAGVVVPVAARRHHVCSMRQYALPVVRPQQCHLCRAKIALSIAMTATNHSALRAHHVNTAAAVVATAAPHQEIVTIAGKIL